MPKNRCSGEGAAFSGGTRSTYVGATYVLDAQEARLMQRERRTEAGASAVEFALVSTVLFLVLFGIIQYGMFFNDSLNARQGVREAVRQGIVKNFSGGTGA